MGAAFFSRFPLEAMAQSSAPGSDNWDRGAVRHLLPTVSDSRILLKVSFYQPLSEAPVLRIDGRSYAGQMSDTAGEFWQFLAADLASEQQHTLSLYEAGGTSLCEPWPLSTFPSPDSRPEQFRMLFYTCAGGVAGEWEGPGQWENYLPTAIRNRLLRRALSFAPDAVVANGDHIYWDLHYSRGANAGKLTEYARQSDFDYAANVLATKNELGVKKAAGPQITPVYGVDFRSTPMFFLQDDHDHWENDGVSDEIATYPIAWFQLQLARATQRLYYPEFLPDARRPAGLPWSGADDRGDVSESFGTVRYGDLAEVLLYDVRRTMNLAGPNAIFVDTQVEKWLIDRSRAYDTRHLVHAPSNPFGWSAGKWGEWYPDILDRDAGELTTRIEKPYWQEGWLRQHDRLAAAMASRIERAPLTISGDLHTMCAGQIHRAGTIDLGHNPINAVVSGPIGTRRQGFISMSRGIGATPPQHLDVDNAFTPREDHGFTLIDFLRDKIVLRQFAWDADREPPEAIDHLQPFHTAELEPPA